MYVIILTLKIVLYVNKIINMSLTSIIKRSSNFSLKSTILGGGGDLFYSNAWKMDSDPKPVVKK